MSRQLNFSSLESINLASDFFASNSIAALLSILQNVLIEAKNQVFMSFWEKRFESFCEKYDV
jgi:hypothetical protein